MLTTPYHLHHYLRTTFHLDLPFLALDESSSTPFDYILHSFFDSGEDDKPRDSVVWASRGGGKTFLNAVATALDLIHKPGIEVRILAGSLEQAQRTHEHLRTLFDIPELAELLAEKITDRRITLANGSRAHVLAASETSVRGCRPQILRCDEVELFAHDLWQAAQLVTRSKQCGDVFVRGAVHAFSTLHKPGGLMAELVADSIGPYDERSAAPDAPRTLFRWSTLDVLERCAPARDCAACPLFSECKGRAKAAQGFVYIDDAIAMKKRASENAWSTEMLCLRPQRSHLVYPEFDPDLHVADFPDPPRAPDDSPPLDGSRFLCAMDFGIRAPTVVLWAHLAPDGMLRILDAFERADVKIDAHADAIADGRGSGSTPGRWPVPTWTAADPAGNNRSEQTGISTIHHLRQRGLSIADARRPLTVSLDLVRRRLRPAHNPGSPTLLIHKRCAPLIRALQKYHYPENDPHTLDPAKDGPDHAADALRYLILNIDKPCNTQRGRYIAA
ncbi:MAG: hypothetical protein IBJ10_06055 [Phycisphaerales bacterium]|nr:hypothetical protein [Phycisphaerales bacterium]